MNDQETVDRPDVEPIEGPGTELTRVLHEGDPAQQLAILEAKAELAPKMSAAIQTILMSRTYPQDWTSFGEGDKERVCLSSAGAERVALLFDIRFSDTTYKKEQFTDVYGRGYRYVYEGNAAMGNRVVFAQGIYSTRDKLLGFANDEFKAVENIDERSIQMAAYHIYMGNGVKGLLGLRAIPRPEFDKIMSGQDKDPAKATKVTHASGTKGGTSQDDRKNQTELAKLCIQIASQGFMVGRTGNGVLEIMQEPEIELPELERAKSICVQISGFEGKDQNSGEKKWVDGKGAKELSGKWLNNSLRKAQELMKNSDQFKEMFGHD